MNKKTRAGSRIIPAVLCMSFVVTNFAPGAKSDTITFESLLEEMVDRDCLARLPSPTYTCRQFSSYDRNSTEPGSPTWWANWDRSYFVRIEDNKGRKEHVLMDAGGPGAIVRFWAIWHGPGGGDFSNGILRVYIDKKVEPVIEGETLPIVRRSGGVTEIPIWSGIAPGSAKSTLKEEYRNRAITDGTRATRDRSIRGVTRPTLTVYLPTQDKTTGAAVVICPGGGFSHLAIDKEGYDVARWLQSHGIAGIVVTYRLPDPEVGLYVPNGSIPDMQRAIRIVRRNAGKWNIDPKRIGVMGFSAGGYMAAAAGTLFDKGDPQADDPIRRVSCRPDFIVPIYPLISLELQGNRSAGLVERMLGRASNDKLIGEYSLDTRVTSQTPPTFLVHAHDDGLSVEHSIRFYLALRKAKVSSELHVYSKGGHGFGMRQRGQPVSAWRERWLEWMKTEGFLLQSEQP